MSTPAHAQLLDLTGKTALVTGAGHGIGAAIARRLAEAGAQVIVHYRHDHDGAEATVAGIVAAGGHAIPAAAELSDSVAVAALTARAVSNFGALDILVNNAGTFPTGPLLELSVTAWRDMFSANVETAFLCTQSAALHMKASGGGAIVNIASIAALSPGPNHSHYNSSKAALVMLTQSAAQELGAFGIRVNAVSPGVIERPGIEDDWPDGVRRWRARAPLQRLGHAGDVADACLFLLAPAARWITGQNLVVDGGMLATGHF